MIVYAVKRGDKYLSRNRNKGFVIDITKPFGRSDQIAIYATEANAKHATNPKTIEEAKRDIKSYGDLNAFDWYTPYVIQKIKSLEEYIANYVETEIVEFELVPTGRVTIR